MRMFGLYKESLLWLWARSLRISPNNVSSLCLLLFTRHSSIHVKYCSPRPDALRTDVPFLCLIHWVHTEWQLPLSGVHSIMMEKSAQPGKEGGGALPPPFTISAITCKVAVSAPAERANTPPSISTLPQYVLCCLVSIAVFFLVSDQK